MSMKDYYTARALALINASLPYGEQPWAEADIEKAATRQDGCSAGISKFYKKILGKKASYYWGCILHDILYERGGGQEVKMAADVLLHDYMQECGAGKKALARLWYSLRAKVFFWAVMRGADLNFNWRPR